MSRTFHIPTSIDRSAKAALNGLLENRNNPLAYRQNMVKLGELLASTFMRTFKRKNGKQVLAISTAEDADYLLTGVLETLKESGIDTSVAVFWNHHYSLPSNKKSVAPILHKYLEPGYENADTIVIVKSVISGSCVVHYNLLAMLEQVKKVKQIFIVSPVMHSKAREKLSAEFPKEISDKFEYIFFALDDERNQDGEVIPGIGGQIYQLLGLSSQPVLTGYIPNLVRNAINI